MPKEPTGPDVDGLTSDFINGIHQVQSNVLLLMDQASFYIKTTFVCGCFE